MLFIGNLPYISRDFAVPFRRFSDFNRKIESNNFYFLRYSENNVSQLPHPYDTRCFSREYFEKNGRTRKADCLNKMLKPLERSPSSEILTQGSPFKPVSHKDIDNKTLKNHIEEIENMCDSQCPRTPCKYSYAVTHAQSFYDSGIKNNGVILSIMIPKTPSLLTTSYPMTTFFEYALYVMSSFGVWLGMSAVALNPFTRLIELKNKRGREVLRCIRQTHSNVTSIGSTFLHT